MNMVPGRYTKAILALFLAAGTAAVTALQNDGRIDGLEWLGLLAALLTGIAVYLAKNQLTGVWVYAKAIVTALGAAITGLATALANNGGAGVGIGELLDRVTPDEWLSLIMAVFSGVLVAVAPNAAVSDDPPQPGGDPNTPLELPGEDYDPELLPVDDAQE